MGKKGKGSGKFNSPSAGTGGPPAASTSAAGATNSAPQPRSGASEPRTPLSSGDASRRPSQIPTPPSMPLPPPPSSNLPRPSTSGPQFVFKASNPMWEKVKTLDPDLRGSFLAHNFLETHGGLTNLKLWQILHHFFLSTRCCPNHEKDKLMATIKTDVIPYIQPFILPPPPPSMDTDRPARPDFNPVGCKVKREQLRDAIRDADPDVEILKSARIDDIRLLYQAYVNPNLVIPGQSAVLNVLRIVSADLVSELTMEELRITLQDRNPKVFVDSIPMTKTVLENLYLVFVLQEPERKGRLVAGYNYSFLPQ